MPNLSKFRTTTLTIDGQPVTILARRLKLEEAEAYKSRLRVLLDTRADAQALAPEEAAFVRESIETNLSLAPGELTVDGEPVTTGAQLLDVIGENPGLVLRALLAINGTARLTEAEGKRSASESDLVPSSDAHSQAPDGPRPAPTAADAGPAGTALCEAATAETGRPSSGPTTTVN